MVNGNQQRPIRGRFGTISRQLDNGISIDLGSLADNTQTKPKRRIVTPPSDIFD